MSLHNHLCVGNAKKLISKIAVPAGTANASIAEVETVLRAAGFVRVGGNGSHRGYRHADSRKVVIPCHDKNLPL